MSISKDIETGNTESTKAVRRFIIKQGQYFQEDVLGMEIKTVAQQNYPPAVFKQAIVVGDDWDWRTYNSKYLESLRDTPGKSLRNKLIGVLRSFTHIKA
mgnify:CR=1 FL=1